MKKLTALILAAGMVLSLAACGENAEETKSEPGTTAAAVSSEASQAETKESTLLTEADTQPSSEAEPQPSRGGALNLALKISKSNDIHGSGGTSVYSWAAYVFEPILTCDSDGNFQKGVCDFSLSDDQLRLTLWVRDGAVFHDGTPVTIEDVTASLNRFGKSGSGMQKPFARAVVSLDPEFTEKDGRKCAVYTFKNYSNMNVFYICGARNGAFVMPKRIIDRYPAFSMFETEDLIGTGPYKVAEYEAASYARLERFEDYKPYNEGGSGQAAPQYAYFDTISVYNIPEDDEQAARDMLSGKYDAAVLDLSCKSILPDEKFKITGSPSERFALICFNGYNQENQVHGDPNLRKAILAAIDYEQLAGVYGNVNSLPICPIGEGIYNTDAFTAADYFGKADPELAKKYLAASNVDISKPIIYANHGSASETDTLILAALEALGLKTQVLTPNDWVFDIESMALETNYDLTVMDTPVVSYIPSMLSADVKYRFWNNERKDELFDEIDKYAAGSRQSLDAWEELVSLWIEDAQIAPLFKTCEPLFSSKDLVLHFSDGSTFFGNCYWKNPAEHAAK